MISDSSQIHNLPETTARSTFILFLVLMVTRANKSNSILYHNKTQNMTPHSSTRSNIQDLVSRIELVTESLEEGNLEPPYTLMPHEERKLLSAIRNLAGKLEGSDTTTWKIIFGVIIYSVLHAFQSNASTSREYFVGNQYEY